MGLSLSLSRSLAGRRRAARPPGPTLASILARADSAQYLDLLDGSTLYQTDAALVPAAISLTVGAVVGVEKGRPEARRNLLRSSEDLTQSAWSKSGVNVTAVGGAPGSFTVARTNDAYNAVQQNFNKPASTSFDFAFSGELAPVLGDFGIITVQGSGSNERVGLCVNLVTGEIPFGAGERGAFVMRDFSVSPPDEDGYRRIDLELTSDANSTIQVYLAPSAIERAYVDGGTVVGSSPASMRMRAPQLKFGDKAEHQPTGALYPFAWNSVAPQSTSSFRATRVAGGLQFDGTDDRYTGIAPPASGSLTALIDTSTGGRIIAGSMGASNGRCAIGLTAAGLAAGALGDTGTATINGGPDIRGTGLRLITLTWDGDAVSLWLDGDEVWSGAQAGAPSSVPIMWGALSSNGSYAAGFAGIMARALMLDYPLTRSEIRAILNSWS
ncbi:MAG: phage head spike fiber domain-containing protein [Glycocaulis sp.]